MKQQWSTRRWAALAVWAAVWCAVSGAWAVTPPAGFEDHVVVDPSASTGAATPVGIAYEPGTGDLLVLEKGDGSAVGVARVRRRNATTGVVTTALSISCVDSAGERGLLGIAFDPDYLVGGTANRWVYFYYTRAVQVTGSPCAIAGTLWGGYNWVVRYHESGGVLTGEQVLLRGPQLEANNHQGGSVRFGVDKTLFASMGDNDTDAYAVPAARNLNDLRGKILRINRDGTIPANNPFVGQSGKRAEVWAFGVRNPFRFSVDEVTGTVYIADVGEARWEEVNAGASGADFGWPCFEAGVTYRSCSPPPSGDVKPIYAYDHGQGDSIIGGPVYHGTSFPPEYQGRYFFGDYGGNWIRSAAVAANGTLTDVTTFVPDATSVTDMAVSPAGCLTWVSIAGLGVHDVCRVGGNNAQPQAHATAVPMSGLAPLTVQFDGSASSDPDQDPLSYAWAFGDTTTGSSAAPSKTYTTTGVRLAVLTVNDGTGTSNATDAAPSLRIVVGNRSPSGSIGSPVAGAHYNAGDTIAYSGGATDPEDGTLPASGFSWLIVFHHDDHTHPFLGPIVGVKSGTFVIPATGEDATNVFFRIALTVTDSGAPLGATGTIAHDSYVDVVPNLTTVTVAATPPGAGLQLAIDQIPAIAPWSKSTVAEFPRVLTAITPQTLNGATWTFVSWSDGGAAEHTVAPPLAPATHTATYQCTAGCAFTPSLTVALIAPDTAHLQWGSLTCASSYDVVRGDLSMLKNTFGNFSMSTVACVANDTTLTTLDDLNATPAQGLWFLVSGNGCGGAGSYDEAGVPSQTGTRTSEITSSAFACP